MKVVAASGAILSTKQELREFKAAAEKYLRDAARSPHAAHETLVRIGVSVDPGNSTKRSPK